MGFVGEVVFVSGSRFCCCYEYICKFGCPVSFEEESQFFFFFFTYIQNRLAQLD